MNDGHGHVTLRHVHCGLAISVPGYGVGGTGFEVPISYAGVSTTVKIGAFALSERAVTQTLALMQQADELQNQYCMQSIMDSRFTQDFTTLSQAFTAYVAALPKLTDDTKLQQANSQLAAVLHALPGGAPAPTGAAPATAAGAAPIGTNPTVAAALGALGQTPKSPISNPALVGN